MGDTREIGAPGATFNRVAGENEIGKRVIGSFTGKQTQGEIHVVDVETGVHYVLNTTIQVFFEVQAPKGVNFWDGDPERAMVNWFGSAEHDMVKNSLDTLIRAGVVAAGKLAENERKEGRIMDRE